MFPLRYVLMSRRLCPIAAAIANIRTVHCRILKKAPNPHFAQNLVSTVMCSPLLSKNLQTVSELSCCIVLSGSLPTLLGTPGASKKHFSIRRASRGPISGPRDTGRACWQGLHGNLMAIACRHESNAGAERFRRGKGSRLVGGPGSWYSHAQTVHSSRKPRDRTPSRAGTPAPPKRGFPGRKGGPGSKGSGGPGSWCSSDCVGSRAVGMPRAGPPQ